jgi:hypothetical protein
MDVFPKFIVEDDCLVIGKCTFHKQLAISYDHVKGGGIWKWDKENSTFTLSGESHDFGAASADAIRACIKAGNVFWSYNGGRRIWGHTFYYNDGIETIKL